MDIDYNTLEEGSQNAHGEYWCKCVIWCHGGRWVKTSKTYRKHQLEKRRRDLYSSPTIHAVPSLAPLTIDTHSAPNTSAKVSRPRSNSDEVPSVHASIPEVVMSMQEVDENEMEMDPVPASHDTLPAPAMSTPNTAVPEYDHTTGDYADWHWEDELDFDAAQLQSDDVESDDDLDPAWHSLPQDVARTPSPAPSEGNYSTQQTLEPTPSTTTDPTPTTNTPSTLPATLFPVTRIGPGPPPHAAPLPLPEPIYTAPSTTRRFTRPEWLNIPLSDLKIEKHRLSLAFIQGLLDANRANSQLSPEDAKHLWDPPRFSPSFSDPNLRHSLKLFLANSHSSIAAYEECRSAAEEHLKMYTENWQLLSHYMVKRKLAELTGITPIYTDMCVKSCVAYTGPFSHMDKCPYPGCAEPRYDPEKLRTALKKIPRLQFCTLPIGLFLQSLWRHPATARALKCKRAIDEEILRAAREGRKISREEWWDILHGSDYEKLVLDGTIKPEDMVLLFSVDGAQLYSHKESDCWIAIWVILDLDPSQRVKKKFVIPAFTVPGPNPPKNMDSYAYVTFHHLATIQNKGLPIWDSSEPKGSTMENFVSHPFMFLSTADAPGQQHMSGSNGHTSKLLCREFCGLEGRHRPRTPQYFAALLKPNNSTNSNEQDDIKISSLRMSPTSEESMKAYHDTINFILNSRNKTDFKARQTITGFSKPSITTGVPRSLGPPGIFPGDIMHWLLNAGDLLAGLWCKQTTRVDCYPPDHQDLWDWAVLTGNTWKVHGAAVASSTRCLPTSFYRICRDPSEKINSSYKAIEWQHWLFGLGPGLLYGVLPQKYWENFCKLVTVIRILHQRVITRGNLKTTYKLYLEFMVEFEELYYQRNINRLHFVRTSIHNPLHYIHEIRCVGNLILYAQWALERTIGNLGEEIKQPSNPFQNLAQITLKRAWTNNLKAMDPTFDKDTAKETTVPTGGRDIGDGYMLLAALKRSPSKPSSQEEIDVLKRYLVSERGRPFNEKTDLLTLRRWARLRIPEIGQTARTLWKEHNRSRTPRVSRMVSYESIPAQPNASPSKQFGEVQYFFRYDIEPGVPRALAMVSEFLLPDEELLRLSSGALHACRYAGLEGLKIIPAKQIKSVVAMVPFPEVGTGGVCHE